MPLPSVLIAHRHDLTGQAPYQETLGARARLHFLRDVAEADRDAVLAAAEVMFCLHPGGELKPEEWARLPRLRLLQMITAGIDHLPHDLLPPGVPIASNGGAYSEPIAEHVLAMALAAAKRLLVEQRGLQGGRFNIHVPNRMLRGMTAGIVGFGGIGQVSAAHFRAMGVRILALNRSGRTTAPVDFCGTLADLDRVLGESDILLLALPNNRATGRLLTARALGLMKPDAILINVGRAHVVDQGALYAHLRANPAFTACIDVWWREDFRDYTFAQEFPFMDLPNVIGSPHNSSTTPGVLAHAARLAAQNVARFLAGETPRHLATPDDLPDLSLLRAEEKRRA